MFQPDSTHAPNIAIFTITCGWSFIAVAIFAVALLLWSRRITGLALRSEDYILFITLAATMGLVAHTTWAVIDEGYGKQLRDVSKEQRGKIVRVYFPETTVSISKTQATF